MPGGTGGVRAGHRRDPHTSAIPTAGPATAVGFGRPPGGGPRGPGGASAQTGAPGGLRRDGQDGRAPWGGQDGGRPPGGRGGAGGLLDAGTPPAELTALLRQDGCTWTAATVGSNNAAAYQLATGLPVMAVGGFNDTDPAPHWPGSSSTWPRSASTTP
ncbi:hypothetical protein ABZ815_46490 [Nonomuraea sp. NPDC047529]|uniref:hypothetical protein n=1 Tax=Nonomuraea sp. NPDC047529 TaxID=3155623 RepID=UPI0033CF2323